MRLFSSPPQKHVAIIIDQNQLTCAWLEQPQYRAPFIIKAYEQHTLDAPNTADCLFNPTAIGAAIAQFIKTQMGNHPFKHTLISCAFTPALIAERLVKLNHATPAGTDFPKYHSSHAAAQNATWDSHYLYPTDTHEYVFYVCGIAQPILLQYKLISLTHKFNLHTTTSQTAALLQLYRYTQGAAFRSSQLGVDMHKAHNNPELLFSDELARRVITIPELNYAVDKKTALTLAGLMAHYLLALS